MTVMLRDSRSMSKLAEADIALRHIFQAEPVYSGAATFFAMLVLPTLFAYGLDERIVDGVSTWSKPLKFELSLALYFATLALFASFQSPTGRLKRMLDITAVVAVGCALFEIGYIIIQASRGVRSHFNQDTPIEAALFALMGVGAILLTLAAPILGTVILRRPTPGLDAVMKRSIGIGLVLTFALGAVGGMIMAAHGSHWVGGPATDADGLPLFGWSRTAGDLRVPHFFGIHAMQILPLAAFVALRAGARSIRSADWLVLGLVLVTVATGVQALLGRPFIPFLG